jgi:isopenicillin-N epimerase
VDEVEGPRGEWWELDPTVAHLNHGAFGAVPRTVLAEQRRWHEAVERNPTEFYWRTLPREMNAVRRQVAAFVGADPGRCVLLPNVTSGIGLVLASVMLAKGDEVLLTDDTYPGVRAAAEAACARVGAKVVTAALPADDLSSAAIERAVLECVTGRTRLAIIDHITSPTAVLVDVIRLTAALKASGVCVAIDGAHAPGSIPLNVDVIGADFYTGNFHKWCCAPRGSAFLAVGEGHQAEVIRGVVGSRAMEGYPTGLEWRGTTDYSAILSTPAALTFLQQLGWDDVQAQNRAMVTRGAELVATALHAQPPPRALVPMVSMPLETNDADAVHRLREELATRRIEVTLVVCRRQGYLRISSHLYSQLDDFTRLAGALTELLPGRRDGPLTKS